MVEIFYFSGTGNSLHIATELQKRLPETILTPMLAVRDKKEVSSTADAVGIVVPIYAFSLPWIAEHFLRRLHLSPGQYLFACTSRLCSERVFRRIEGLLPLGGAGLKARFSVVTPENYIPVFPVDPSEQQGAMERRLQDRLEEITAAVVRREEVRVKDGPLRLVTYTLFPLATALYRATGFFGLAKRFYADEACRGCGQCVRVCLAGRITLADGRPRWDPAKPCLYCLACLHYCPAAAIQLKRTRSTRRGRYHHPAVSAEQIAAQRGSTTAD